MAGYAALTEAYEWLMPDAKLPPAGSVAAFADVVQSLPPNARVLYCCSEQLSFWPYRYEQLVAELQRVGLR